jgi:hypothetical protein
MTSKRNEIHDVIEDDLCTGVNSQGLQNVAFALGWLFIQRHGAYRTWEEFGHQWVQS